jgi:hypothetical protein
MNVLQKALLALAVAGLVIGIPVTASRARLDPRWTLALPVGVTCLGLFLIERLWHDALTRSDSGERPRTEAAKRQRAAGSRATMESTSAQSSQGEVPVGDRAQ